MTSDLHREARELLTHREKWGVLDPSMTWAVRELLAENERLQARVDETRHSFLLLAEGVCRDCDGTLESCAQSRIKCCPDCTHATAGAAAAWAAWFAAERDYYPATCLHEEISVDHDVIRTGGRRLVRVVVTVTCDDCNLTLQTTDHTTNLDSIGPTS
ncbi:hypothetical protein L5I01_17385 [Gordonia sp. HY442]|uniref:hypothetical protein n=1 Tax=Gordonia zhenghanii TaxID=2911516 RepID=UPI001F401071|nr:hypothetical protein [Gordonia zhenghanii]MCF8605130.1 hypothetical protein [Gordonia zhenghanii]